MVGRPTREELLEALGPVARTAWRGNVPLDKVDLDRINDLLDREARYVRGTDSKEKSDFESLCDGVNAHVNWYGQEVAGSYGSTYTVVGIDPDRPRNKIRGISKNGKLRYFSVDVVGQQLGRGPMAPLRRGRLIDLD